MKGSDYNMALFMFFIPVSQASIPKTNSGYRNTDGIQKVHHIRGTIESRHQTRLAVAVVKRNHCALGLVSPKGGWPAQRGN